MQHWEYLTIFVSEVRQRQEHLAALIGFQGSWETAFGEAIDKCGADGWELIQILKSELPIESSIVDQPFAIFK